MRYFYKPGDYNGGDLGEIYHCRNHPAYEYCTLFEIGGKGLAIIKQNYDKKTKVTCWGPLESNLANDIYLNKNFKDYFKAHAGKMDKDGIYPTYTVRQVMWALKMKPIPKQRWETVFDRHPI